MTDLIKMLFSDPLPPKSTGFQGIKCGALPCYLFASVSSCIQRLLQNNSKSNNDKNNETSQRTYYLVSFVVSSIVCVLL